MERRHERKVTLAPADDQTDVLFGEGVAIVDDGRGLRPATEREIRELQATPPEHRR